MNRRVDLATSRNILRAYGACGRLSRHAGYRHLDRGGFRMPEKPKTLAEFKLPHMALTCNQLPQGPIKCRPPAREARSGNYHPRFHCHDWRHLPPLAESERASGLRPRLRRPGLHVHGQAGDRRLCRERAAATHHPVRWRALQKRGRCSVEHLTIRRHSQGGGKHIGASRTGQRAEPH
ncbi:hypothetical protein ABIE78_002789 [Sinorhizobium fredii]